MKTVVLLVVLLTVSLELGAVQLHPVKQLKPVPVSRGYAPNGLDLDAPLSSIATVARINSNAAYTWSADLYTEHWAGKTVGDMVKMCGAILGENFEDLGIPVKDEEGDVPGTFDARVKWPSSIHPIRNQKSCGSCWAFSSTEVLSDRFSVASANQIDVVLSPEDMVSCDRLDNGCHGGFLPMAWHYLKSKGVVKDTCFPYTAGEAGQPDQCRRQCVGDEKFAKYKASSYYKLAKVQAIMTDIYQNGPVQAAMLVYADFPSYKTGVYQKTVEDTIGGHAIKIVGWGSEKGLDYWLIANSWGDQWGENGYFRIRRGVDECGIESQIYAGLPDVDNAPKAFFG
mmetsp:Transcript_26199/g.45078  ORF Transcript_26199/g.45078 Transcript_26199/m.45078 type:complete len:340 (-) Transcript_26199:525-1544(-)|eukprot:CAMPEP_0196654318 /NCGR_PEP_ID=MMETSP1086-20130531/4021_1 /TAXON_ID=77921 /ORGANISM="Cyanoptyche  gloeocystis , Strain SAG4.97" /LENGTH=339 /DNA_ID=CAMNT_0041986005 /DNA_START=155 /DNA_END=1174 /DNA_ORIENTATION=-